MINIAICDDDNLVCTHIEDIIRDNFPDTRVDIFYSGEKFLQTVEKVPFYTVVFLDIEMQIISGLSVGSRLRNDFDNNTTQIVYISSKKDYAMELFKIRPFNFLIKPINPKDIIDTMAKIIRIYGETEKFFECYIEGEFSRIPYSKILYFESTSRKLKIATLSGNFYTYMGLKDVCNSIDGNDFQLVHRSYLVNFNHLKTYTYENIIMVNGDYVMISQSKRKAVRTYFLKRRSNFHV